MGGIFNGDEYDDRMRYGEIYDLYKEAIKYL